VGHRLFTFVVSAILIAAIAVLVYIGLHPEMLSEYIDFTMLEPEYWRN
jgi:uncharacterized membrane protein